MYVGIIAFWLQINFRIFINTLCSIQGVYNVFSSIVQLMRHMSCWVSSCFYEDKINYYDWGLITAQTLCLRALHDLPHWTFTLTLWVRSYPPYVHKGAETQTASCVCPRGHRHRGSVRIQPSVSLSSGFVLVTSMLLCLVVNQHAALVFSCNMQSYHVCFEAESSQGRGWLSSSGQALGGSLRQRRACRDLRPDRL